MDTTWQSRTVSHKNTHCWTGHGKETRKIKELLNTLHTMVPWKSVMQSSMDLLVFGLDSCCFLANLVASSDQIRLPSASHRAAHPVLQLHLWRNPPQPEPCLTWDTRGNRRGGKNEASSGTAVAGEASAVGPFPTQAGRGQHSRSWSIYNPQLDQEENQKKSIPHNHGSSWQRGKAHPKCHENGQSSHSAGRRKQT